ncbi:MAG: BatA and WFA domain-containing protein [Bacteroidota bacterium]|nr:BatA domain-containing protein [Candidatus Kapabacteria bacterium]MCS7302662.1 BatA domain-containing protein [Candidatus Kapabacteria bacterium]MDW8074936.1 BatA and WFA domain-containing protein [Bacteroidota bacterium]MDW8271575.1 BatA and WFA domain-containing protein [Bacteroidota bacterium]
MQFFNPWMLVGLVAAAIPILLHLLNLRKLRRIEFSTLRFLHELQRSHIRRLKLQQWLLLILRTALVIFAVLAFARPVLPTSLPVLGGPVRSSVVIVLDNSASMDTRDERGNRFRWAIRQAQNILEALKSGDEVALITTTAMLQSRGVEFTTALSALRDELSALPLAYGTVSLDDMLSVARDVLARAQNAHRELYVISDFQTNAFRWQDSVVHALAVERVILLPAALSTRLEQLDIGVDSVAVLSQLVEPEKPIEVFVRLRNNTGRPAQGTIVRMYFNDQQVAQRSVDIPPGQVYTLTLTAPVPSSGFLAGRVTVEPDACDANNTRYFALLIPSLPRVLIVGTPSTSQYVETALAAMSERRQMHIRRVAPEQVGSVNLEEWDVVVVTEPPSRSGIERLKAYVSKGQGNAFIFASSALSFDEQQRFAAEMAIGDVVLLRPQKGSSYDLHADENHPLFAGVFRKESHRSSQLESPSIEQALVSRGGVALIGTEGGAFLSEHMLGQGRILYCAVPPTMQWSSFPVTGLFPVVINRALLYLSARNAVSVMYSVGQRCRLELPQNAAMAAVYRVRDPNGAEAVVPAVVVGGRTILDLGYPLLPGAFVVEATTGSAPVATAAVNIPSSETVLEFVERQRAASYISTRVGKEQIEIAEPHETISTLVARQRQRAELWPWLIAGALLCALGEMIVASQVARRSTI